MAEVATTDAVLTAFFLDTNGVCDKIELATGIMKASSIAKLAVLDAKHAAGTAFCRADGNAMVRSLQEYVNKVF